MVSDSPDNSAGAAQHRRMAADDGLVVGIEMVATPLIVAAVGFGVDTWIGTRPLFTALGGGLAFAAKIVSAWYRYVDRMRRHEADIAADRTADGRGLRRPDTADDAYGGLPERVTLEEPPDAADGEPTS
ncbi:MAG TPA: hypothetical protein DEP66_04195 [Acidimicrobiaceae bacterium]|nr:hypothetical protein [Acidimicrobiaceae bacterium]HCB37403.1 hypothetical protein [Acidimicrobiaceae bacterium]